MEILTTHTAWFQFILGGTALGIITLGMTVLTVYWIATGLRDGLDDPMSEGFGIVCFTLVSVFLIFAFIFGVKAGPDVTYTAIVTDYNEVYAKGYEVVGRDGELVKLKEAE